MGTMTKGRAYFQSVTPRTSTGQCRTDRSELPSFGVFAPTSSSLYLKPFGMWAQNGQIPPSLFALCIYSAGCGGAVVSAEARTNRL